jgi:hypothetical protein
MNNAMLVDSDDSTAAEPEPAIIPPSVDRFFCVFNYLFIWRSEGTYYNHRNLSMESACLSCSCIHFGKKTLVKSLLIITLEKGNLLQWNIYTGLNKTSLLFTK